MNGKYSGFSNMRYFRMFLREKGSKYRDMQAELLLISLEYEKEIQQIYQYHNFNPVAYERFVRERETWEIRQM